MLLVSCSDNQVSKTKLSNNPPSNTYIINHDGLTRSYILKLPENWKDSEPLSVLFNFHGFGGDAQDFFDYTDMEDLANESKTILVFPQGSLLDGMPHWNASLPGGDNKSDTDDFGFIEKLMNTLQENYSIDENKVFATGYSNGGMFAYALSCYKPNLITAVGSVSGAMLDLNCNSEKVIPVISIHGTDDTVISYNGDMYYHSVGDVLDYWITRNRTSTNALFEGSQTVEKYSYLNDLGDELVVHHKFIDGGHLWFQSPRPNENASDLIWQFFFSP